MTVEMPRNGRSSSIINNCCSITFNHLPCFYLYTGHLNELHPHIHMIGDHVENYLL